MAVTWWWLALIVAGAFGAIAILRYRMAFRRPNAPRDGLWLAHLSRIRELPRFQALVKRETRRVMFEISCLTMAALGILAMVARPVLATMDSEEMRGRDVMLCLDVSGSMLSVDQLVVETYLNLVDQLQGERVGFVIWDSTAVTVFPLTSDYKFIREQLSVAADALAAKQQEFLAGVSFGFGSSLIGDGLMSCVNRFDQRQELRPRTVIFVTDNELAGKPLFSLRQAIEDAAAQEVMVYGITVDAGSGAAGASPEIAELSELVKLTGGELFKISDGKFNPERIVQGIESKQRQAILRNPKFRSFDLVWPGAALLALGLCGLIGVRVWEDR